MKYFRVKKEYDNFSRTDGGVLVKNEMYTKREVERYKIPSFMVVEVEVKSLHVYTLFGCRFCVECGYRS